MTRLLQKLGVTAAATGLLSLCGCQSATTSDPVPAILTAPSAEITAELGAGATELLSGAPVTLGSTAFITSSELTLEPALRKSPLGRLGRGRMIEPPDALRLLRAGNQCVLEHINSGDQVVLKTQLCAPAPIPQANSQPN